MALEEYLDRLAERANFSAGDRAALKLELRSLVPGHSGQGAMGSRTLQQLVVTGDLDVPAGSVRIGQTAPGHGNILMRSGGINLRTNATVKIDLQTDGDVFIGTDTSLPATTNLAIFTVAQTYNQENVDVGDMLFGDNSASKANILWDKSAGTLNFRGGTTTQAYVDTTGAITAGAGNVVINNTGINLDPADTGSGYLYLYGALTAATPGGAIYGQSSSTNYTLSIRAKNNVSIVGSDYSAILQLASNSAATSSSNYIFIFANRRAGGAATIPLRISTDDTVHIVDGLLRVWNNLTIGQAADGIIVTATGQDGTVYPLRVDHANTLIHSHIRPISGSSGYLTFTEDSVADRWAVGIKGGNASLFFRSGSVATATDRGSVDTSGFFDATGGFKKSGTQVVGARITGYTAMTGSPDKATAYATSTVTLAQLAGRVAQLQADLTTHGLIGA